MVSSSSISSLDDHDESVQIAVRALGDMRNGGPRSEVDTPDFVYRVSQLPIVTSALRVYSQGKASSRVVKYGAEMMESSIQTMARPVIDRLPNVNQIDEFACRQLDRLGRYRKSSEMEHPHSPIQNENDDRGHMLSRSAPSHESPMTREDPANTRSGRRVPSWLEASSPFVPVPPPPPDSRTPTPQSPELSSSERSRGHPGSQRQSDSSDQQLTHRSSWQSVLLEAGGFSAALSEESMRRLKYCLHWLQYATAHIDAQILILRDFTAALQPLPSPTVSARTHSDPISPAHMRTLTDVRRDVVSTIRQVVDVISKYAGGALPEPARTRVRGFILKLPQRWANATNSNSANSGMSSCTSTINTGGDGRKRGRYHHHRERSASLSMASSAGAESSGSSRATSPMSSPRITRSSLTVPPTAGSAVRAAQRILTLATESLDMMRGVTGVVKDSLERADAWVGRLRVVGIQRGPDDDSSGEQRAIEEGATQHTTDGDVQTSSSQEQLSKPDSEEDEDTTDLRTHSYSSSTISSMSSVPSTPYSMPGTPAPGPMDAPSPGVVTGIAGLSLGMAARSDELGLVDIRRQIEERKGRDGEEDVVRMEVDN